MSFIDPSTLKVFTISIILQQCLHFSNLIESHVKGRSMKQVVHKVDEPCNISLNDYTKNLKLINKTIYIGIFFPWFTHFDLHDTFTCSHDTLCGSHDTYVFMWLT